MPSRLIRLGGALAAMAGGALWVFLCWRWHLRIGGGDGVPPLRNTQFLFWIPLLLMGGGVAGLYTRRPLGRLGRTGLGWALVGSLVGAAGVAMMACFRPIQNVMGEAGLDCGPLGEVLSGLGTAALYIGLVLFGSATVKRRVLPRWNALPLVMGLLGLGGLPVGYVAIALGGVGLAELLQTTTRVLFGLGWVALGYVLWSDN